MLVGVAISITVLNIKLKDTVSNGLYLLAMSVAKGYADLVRTWSWGSAERALKI